MKTDKGVHRFGLRHECRAEDRNLLRLGLLLTLYGLSTFQGSAFAGQATTGKIIIDGVVYGNGDVRIEQGSGSLGRERRDLHPFEEVKIAAGIDLIYRHGTTQQLDIIGDHNLIPIIETSVSNGVLTISTRKSYQSHLPLTVELTGPRLNSLTMHGAGDIDLNDLRQESLTLNLNGSGNAHIDGRVNRLFLTVNGAGDVDAERLDSDSADIKLLGSGDISVTAHDTLTATLIGSGDITYFGHPKNIQKQIIGSGDLQAGD